MDFIGTIYSSGTLTASGNSGYFDVSDLTPSGQHMGVIERVFLSLVPANLATDETLDLDLNIAFNMAGDGDVKVHDFTQVTSGNAREDLIIPGGESTNLLQVNLGTDFFMGAPIPPYWKLTWTIAGSTPSMDFALYGVVSSR